MSEDLLDQLDQSIQDLQQVNQFGANQEIIEELVTQLEQSVHYLREIREVGVANLWRHGVVASPNDTIRQVIEKISTKQNDTIADYFAMMAVLELILKKLDECNVAVLGKTDRVRLALVEKAIIDTSAIPGTIETILLKLNKLHTIIGE
ncbi:MAG: hypothetical protein FWG73_06050 [Planctomycetaceae bacterium]|nr:hypothetical protein [Planctomycetaceae bacterium]